MNKSFVFLSLILLGWISNTFAQEKDGQKVILITLDGYRWQELFTGADPQLLANVNYVSDTTDLKEKFWRDTPQERRSVLMPFIWERIAQGLGEIHGNREAGSKMDVANTMWFSYPGYNEILTGMTDDKRITSNNKIYNPNITILEELENHPRFTGKVAAFASWDVFPYIINTQRSQVPVNAGSAMAKGEDLTPIERFLNKIQPNTPSPFGSSARLDFFTDYYALEYIKRKHPDFVYIGNDETDDFAHQGDYSAYLRSAHGADKFLEELWIYLQSDPYYRDKTTIILTTDHGRGTEPLKNWTGHGSDIEGASETWLILFGAQAKKLGEVKREEQFHSTDIVETIKKILEVE